MPVDSKHCNVKKDLMKSSGTQMSVFIWTLYVSSLHLAILDPTQLHGNHWVYIRVELVQTGLGGKKRNIMLLQIGDILWENSKVKNDKKGFLVCFSKCSASKKKKVWDEHDLADCMSSSNIPQTRRFAIQSFTILGLTAGPAHKGAKLW